MSRIVATLRGEWEAWSKQSLADLNVVYLYLDAIALRVRAAGRVTGLPVLAGVAVLSDGSKRLVSLEVCGAESGSAWEGFLQGLIDRGLKAPRLCIIDGNAGLHRAITLAWRGTKIQRCAVHKLRNILRKVPQHAHDEVTDDYHLHRVRVGARRSDDRARRLREEVEPSGVPAPSRASTRRATRS